MDRPYFSLVIPAYNESHRLLSTLRRSIETLDRHAGPWEILVVDDGSQDETVSLANSVAAEDGRVRVIAAPHGGKGAAVRRGMLAARGEWRFFADADLSMDLDQLPRFFDARADVAIASREAPGSRRIGEPPTRHLIGRAFNLVVRMVAVRGIQDTQCGYKMFSADAVQQLFSIGRLNGFAFDVELLYLARRAGFRIAEVPVTWTYRAGSRMKLSTGLAAFLQILEIRWHDMLGRYESGPHRIHSAV